MFQKILTSYLVTLPDYVDEVDAGTAYKIPNNKYNKENGNLATILFDYQHGRENTTSTVQKGYIKNRFTMDVFHYDDAFSYVVNNKVTLIPDYIETIIGATFSENVTRPGYLISGMVYKTYCRRRSNFI